MTESVHPPESAGRSAPAPSSQRSAIPLVDFLQRIRVAEPSTEDVLAACMPLLRQVAELHARGLVAPLEGIDDLRVSGGVIWLENARARSPHTNTAAIEAAQRQHGRGALDVVAHYRRTEDDGGMALDDLKIGERGTRPERPIYVPGFASWEHALDHHDPLTDVFVLGLVMGALASGLDLTSREDLERFVACREICAALDGACTPSPRSSSAE